VHVTHVVMMILKIAAPRRWDLHAARRSSRGQVSLYTDDRRPSSPAIDWLRSVICAVGQQF
jgi:hypothetical protein